MSAKDFVFSWGMVFAYVLLNAYGALVIKYKINQLGAVSFESMEQSLQYFLRLFTSPLILTGLLAIFVSAIAWMAALSRLDLSSAYPVAVGLNFVLVISVAFLSFREPVSALKLVAISLILFGVFLLYRDW
ncbi:Small Multidrug Resistance (SMR) protein [Sinobacterium caligoides]|uniref:Small Multidrug Resistance (SMR) protein n=1 Tax=Sinobacterium caligoides TaxID=933926 RepID=A0A3N2DJY3_9GAMM|nr:SMR family transporter [Sinobacterium caligoides]ROS00113.1 Small Multidrug Resistance (SMR) protein [Sinobacterium caligoides]